MHGVSKTRKTPRSIGELSGSKRVNSQTTSGTTRKFVVNSAARKRLLTNDFFKDVNGICENMLYIKMASVIEIIAENELVIEGEKIPASAPRKSAKK